jgi:hypothetical protein
MWCLEASVRYITGSKVFIDNKLVPATIQIEDGKISDIKSGTHNYKSATLGDNEKVNETVSIKLPHGKSPYCN